MKNHLAILMSDYYKQAHFQQYPNGTSKLTAYFTPRKSRVNNQHIVVFGVQAFIKEYLVNCFNECFFNMQLEDIKKEYERVIKATFTSEYSQFDQWEKLHNLGYLPLELRVLPEGTLCPMQVPCIMVTNTHPEFAWLVEFIESKLSNDCWYPMVAATQAYNYRNIVDKYYSMTVDNDNLRKSAISEFGYRGGNGDDCSEMAGGAFLTSFNKTATIPSLLWLEANYNCDVSEGNVGGGMISTEHSVMCSNYAIDGDEVTFLNKLLTELYPKGNVSVVCDSYDYWNVVENIIGKQLKQDILGREGCLFVRGDSGDPVDIICGEKADQYEHEFDFCRDANIDWYYCKSAQVRVKNAYYSAVIKEAAGTDYLLPLTRSQRVSGLDLVWVRSNPQTRYKGTVELLWDAFGGTVNNKGFKVLDNHIRAIYGDSITPKRAEDIYKRLEEKGFAANNIALGAGSFSLHCVEENGVLKPFTRDTYGIAIKATYGETCDGKKFGIFKNPKTDIGNFKKSQNGLCYVHYDTGGKIVCTDGFDSSTLPVEGDIMKLAFSNGRLYNEQSIHQIRDRLHKNNF